MLIGSVSLVIVSEAEVRHGEVGGRWRNGPASFWKGGFAFRKCSAGPCASGTAVNTVVQKLIVPKVRRICTASETTHPIHLISAELLVHCGNRPSSHSSQVRSDPAKPRIFGQSRVPRRTPAKVVRARARTFEGRFFAEQDVSLLLLPHTSSFRPQSRVGTYQLTILKHSDSE